ncbi:hypothetical protein ACLMJK_000867 [Lecanora helva]
MKVRPEDPSQLSDFSLLSFDCFGTLIDWELGIYEALKPLNDRLPDSNPIKNNKDLTIKAFDDIEVSLCASRPGLKYSTLLEETYVRLVDSLSLPAPPKSEVESIGASISKWPLFPDTIDALHRLHKHYKLVILSNVDRESFDQVLSKAFADVKYDAVYVAGDIGSYKPDPNNFHYLFKHVKEQLSVEKSKILHTAEGLKADHVPAAQLGLTSAWIQRDHSTGPGTKMDQVKDKVAFTWKFNTLGEMADDVERNAAKA